MISQLRKFSPQQLGMALFCYLAIFHLVTGDFHDLELTVPSVIFHFGPLAFISLVFGGAMKVVYCVQSSLARK